MAQHLNFLLNTKQLIKHQTTISLELAEEIVLGITNEMFLPTKVVKAKNKALDAIRDYLNILAYYVKYGRDALETWPNKE